MVISPLNETGHAVDWWFIYKVPKNAKGDAPDTPDSTGYEYAYYDDQVDNVVPSNGTLNQDQGALRLTIDSIFNSQDPSTGWVLYNDERPADVTGTDNGELGHTKGAIFFDTQSQTAVWLLHSWPKYVSPEETNMPTPMFGQTFLALSMTLDAAQILAGQMITHQQPQVFESKLPDDLPTICNLRSLCGTINPNDPGAPSVLPFTTRGGMAFQVIAKNRNWGQDFWNDLVGPTLKEDINVETWIRGGDSVIPDTKDSDGVHNVYDIKYISLRAIGLPWAWPEVQDHAKWAISHADNWICVGDINRMISQRNRGGCTIAFQDAELFKLLEQTDQINVPTNSSETQAVQLVQSTHTNPPATFKSQPIGVANPITSFFTDQIHSTPKQFTQTQKSTTFGCLTGTVDQSSEKPISGRSGKHLQFYVQADNSTRYQVDTNVESSDGSEIQVYVAVEKLQPTNTNPPFGPETYGLSTNASLSYAGIGLNDDNFADASDVRLESQLESALNDSVFVAAYGLTFNDGNISGIHENHFNPHRKNQDGAIAIYMKDTDGTPIRKWFFFKFEGDHIAEAH